jgi:hypothetical protein
LAGKIAREQLLVPFSQVVRNQILNTYYEKHGTIQNETGGHLCQKPRAHEFAEIILIDELGEAWIPKRTGSPLDPYAYVTAPQKTRPSNRSSTAVAELPEK